jgi:hypothetical protein
MQSPPDDRPGAAGTSPVQRSKPSAQRLPSDLSGASGTSLVALHALLPPAARGALLERAGAALSSPSAGSHLASPGLRLLRPGRVFLAPAVFSASECAAVCGAVRSAALERGGWDTDRHSRHRTVDLPLSAAAAVEPLVRARLFERLLRPLAAEFLGPGFLPEHLRFRDVFYVRYAAGGGGQTSLGVHADGSAFSVNVLLSDPADFEGGGTCFEAAGATLKPPRGAALGHSGTVRHGGAPITGGERLLLVGFVDVEPHAYGGGSVGWAAFNGCVRGGKGEANLRAARAGLRRKRGCRRGRWGETPRGQRGRNRWGAPPANCSFALASLAQLLRAPN